MKIRQKNSASFACIAFCVLTIALGTLHAQTQDANRIEAPVMLNRDQASAILPPSVFFRGQSAPIQGRNSAGLRMTDGKLVLSAIVDTSGYSSALQQTYQAYLLTEVPLTIASQKLPPGAYGFGFVAGNMIVMDIGGNEILRVDINRDEKLTRPNPLQILPGGAAAQFRLYLGRNYVLLSSASR